MELWIFFLFLLCRLYRLDVPPLFPRICLRGEVIFLHMLVELYTRFTLLVPLRAVKTSFGNSCH